MSSEHDPWDKRIAWHIDDIHDKVTADIQSAISMQPDTHFWHGTSFYIFARMTVRFPKGNVKRSSLL